MDPCGPWPDGGVEIQDGSNFWICDACWKQMTVFERAKLRLEVKELSEVANINEAIRAIRKINEMESGANEPWRESL